MRGSWVRRWCLFANQLGKILKIVDDKSELFQYLVGQMVSLAEVNKVVIPTIIDISVSLSPDMHLLEIRLVITRKQIRVDTGVVVLAISMFTAFSTSGNFHYIPIHCIVESIGDEKSSVSCIYLV